MKNLINKTVCVLSVSLFCTTPFFSASNLYANDNKHSVQFEINKIEMGDNKIYLQLFKGEENFNKGRALESRIINANANSLMVSFNNLSPGDYAIRLYHDQNNNGKLDTNLFGIPTEGYAFSNDAKPKFGPPSYETMSFVIDETQATVNNSTTINY